jgi:hypothetical protein
MRGPINFGYRFKSNEARHDLEAHYRMPVVRTRPIRLLRLFEHRIHPIRIDNLRVIHIRIDNLRIDNLRIDNLRVGYLWTVNILTAGGLGHFELSRFLYLSSPSCSNQQFIDTNIHVISKLYRRGCGKTIRISDISSREAG